MPTTRNHARFFELSLDLLATANTDGYFVDLNAPWAATLGYSLDELRQKPFIDFVHPADRSATIREAARLHAGEVTVNFENRYRTKSGGWCWLAWTAQFSKEESLIFACARDITPSKNLLKEKDLALSESERFRALAESTTDLVGMVNIEGHSTYLNAAGRRLLGIQNQDVARLTIEDCHPKSYGALILKEGLSRATADGAWTGTGELRTKSGAEIRISQVIVPLRDAKGNLEGYGTIIRDLSVIDLVTKLEHELRAHQATMREILNVVSTPIIPISDRVVVMPLLGIVDGRRTPQLLDALLRAVTTLRARIIIVDVTDLLQIDSDVVSLMLQTAAVFDLLDSRIIFTGLRPDIARTFFSLGQALPAVRTYDTLQSGVAYALSVTADSFSPSP